MDPAKYIQKLYQKAEEEDLDHVIGQGLTESTTYPSSTGSETGY